jgi:signal transduction histidine kinase/streptogramin lyase
MGNTTDATPAALARDGSVWLFRERQLWKVRSGGIVSHFDAPAKLADFVVTLLESQDGKIWLAASDGTLFCLEPSGQWKTIPGTGLRGSNRVLYEDGEGNLWRGSFGGGLTRIRPRVFTLHELPESILDRYAFTVCAEPGGSVWGLLNSHTLARVSAKSPGPEIFTNPSVPRNIRTLFYDQRNTLWAAGDNSILYRMIEGEFKQAVSVGERIEFISAIFEDAQSNLWVGFSGGAGVGVMPNGDTNRWHTIDGIPFPAVRCIAQSADGAMWFGTHYGGVSRLKDGKWTQFRIRDGLSSDYIRCFQADADGTLWLGTLRGLCRWRDGKFAAIKKEDGLWNDSISHIADDGRGNFWISSFGGIYRAKRGDLNDFADGKRNSVPCVGYNRNDGLISLECPGGFQPAGAKTSDGRLWFPTVSGLVSISPSQIKENTQEPNVWIEEVTVDKVPTIVHHGTKSLKIPPGRRRFDFRFTALSLTAPEKVRFRHKLEGLDTDWSPADDQRTASYSYIPPGPYTLKVIACNNDGLWNNIGSSLEVIIQPYIWQTWWFKGSVAALLAVLIAFTVRQAERWNSRLRLERLEQQHAVERERSRIAKDIHDDLGANLTQIVFLSQRAESATEDPNEVERWIRLIPNTARRTIQSLDEIVWAINPRHDSLESLANYLSQFVSDHLNLAGLRAVLDVPTVLPPVQLTAELRHNLVLAAREAVQNVVTHAAATEVRLTLHLDESGLAITIADNGRGFDLNQPSRDGNGLYNMRRRLEDIGGQADITSRPGSGTIVRLFVPQARLHARVIGEHNGYTRIS